MFCYFDHLITLEKKTHITPTILNEIERTKKMVQTRTPTIIDAHCHAWQYWPYEPPVPDPESRGITTQLLHQMDVNGVNHACIVSANIRNNPQNNEYVAAAVREHPTRLSQFADIDSHWSETYHSRGATKRLESAVKTYPMKGFTHYLADEDDGSWLYSDEGREFFKLAQDAKLIASIHCHPHQQKAIREVAAEFSSLPILIHHLGHPSASEPSPHPKLREVLDSAVLPNIYLKFSGFYYTTERKWEYPYSDTLWLYRSAYEHYGPRMVWGSDFPVVNFHMTHRQSLEALRSHCSFINETDMAKILGDNLYKLLHTTREIQIP